MRGEYVGRKSVFFKDGRFRYKSVLWKREVDNLWVRVVDLWD